MCHGARRLSGTPRGCGISIPADVFSSLVRTNTVTQADITGLKNYKNADGQIFQSKTFVIRTLKIGNLEVVKVQAKVAPANAPTSSRAKLPQTIQILVDRQLNSRTDFAAIRMTYLRQ